jgi:uncharacterized HAD superfamily protein
MIIGIDIDEVLSEMIEHFLEYNNRIYGTKYKKEDMFDYNIENVMKLTEAQVLQIFVQFHDSPEFHAIRTKEGSEDAISRLAKKHELHVITARTNDIKEDTHKWLEKNFPEAFKHVHFANDRWNTGTQTKDELCNDLKIQIMVEDNFNFAKKIAARGIKVLLMDGPWNQIETLPENVIRVKNWKEAEKIINEHE